MGRLYLFKNANTYTGVKHSALITSQWRAVASWPALAPPKPGHRFLLSLLMQVGALVQLSFLIASHDSSSRANSEKLPRLFVKQSVLFVHVLDFSKQFSLIPQRLFLFLLFNYHEPFLEHPPTYVRLSSPHPILRHGVSSEAYT